MAPQQLRDTRTMHLEDALAGEDTKLGHGIQAHDPKCSPPGERREHVAGDARIDTGLDQRVKVRLNGPPHASRGCGQGEPPWGRSAASLDARAAGNSGSRLRRWRVMAPPLFTLKPAGSDRSGKGDSLRSVLRRNVLKRVPSRAGTATPLMSRNPPPASTARAISRKAKGPSPRQQASKRIEQRNDCPHSDWPSCAECALTTATTRLSGRPCKGRAILSFTWVKSTRTVPCCPAYLCQRHRSSRAGRFWDRLSGRAGARASRYATP
jgi:hypothetical protein